MLISFGLCKKRLEVSGVSTYNNSIEIVLNKNNVFFYHVTQVFLNNVMRIKSVIMEFVAIGKFVESCLEWESPVRSVTAFVSFLAIVYYMQV